jgi:hypothetical protein
MDARVAGLDGDFDYLVSRDAGEAVSSIARWRHCELIVRQRGVATRWWDWWHADPLEKLAAQAYAPAVLEMSPVQCAPTDALAGRANWNAAHAAVDRAKA